MEYVMKAKCSCFIKSTLHYDYIKLADHALPSPTSLLFLIHVGIVPSGE